MSVKFNVEYEDGERQVKLFAKDQRALDRASAILTALRDAGCDELVDAFVAKHQKRIAVVDSSETTISGSVTVTDEKGKSKKL